MTLVLMLMLMSQHPPFMHCCLGNHPTQTGSSRCLIVNGECKEGGTGWVDGAIYERWGTREGPAKTGSIHFKKPTVHVPPSVHLYQREVFDGYRTSYQILKDGEVLLKCPDGARFHTEADGSLTGECTK